MGLEDLRVDTILEDIREERQRTREYQKSEHDHDRFDISLVRTAANYAMGDYWVDPRDYDETAHPWGRASWNGEVKPIQDVPKRERLVKAAALLVAEIEKLDRVARKSLPL